MYEGVTYDKLVKGMLDTALAETSTVLDTREGSMLWYGVAPAAVELTNLYIQMDWILDQSFADTATRPYLIRRAAERGMSPYPASPSVIQAKVTPAGFQLPLGARFSLGEVNFAVTEAEGGGFLPADLRDGRRGGQHPRREPDPDRVYPRPAVGRGDGTAYPRRR